MLNDLTKSMIFFNVSKPDSNMRLLLLQSIKIIRCISPRSFHSFCASAGRDFDSTLADDLMNVIGIDKNGKKWSSV